MADEREAPRCRQFLARSHVKFLLSVLLACGFCFFFVSSARPPSESCVRCHTDPSVMKTMVKVPAPPSAEEGAG